MLISEKYNISLDNLCKSETAIKKGIKNIPDDIAIKNLQLLVKNIYEPVCDHFKIKIPFNSAFRNIQLNKAVGGSLHSEHLYGMAIDLDGDSIGISNRIIFEWIRDNLKFGQLIYEYGTDEKPDWVHVSYNFKLQKECLRTKLIEKKVTYYSYNG